MSSHHHVSRPSYIRSACRHVTQHHVFPLSCDRDMISADHHIIMSSGHDRIISSCHHIIRNHPGDTQDAPEGIQKTPSRHPGDTQDVCAHARKTLPGPGGRKPSPRSRSNLTCLMGLLSVCTRHAAALETTKKLRPPQKQWPLVAGVTVLFTAQSSQRRDAQ